MFYGKLRICLLWKTSETSESCVLQNNLHLNAPEDIADNITKIGLTFKRLYTNANAFICETLPRDSYCEIN